MTSDVHFFNCTRCGDCCEGYGGTYLSEADLSTIAGHLKISVSELRDKYCVISGGRFVLAQREDGYCIFWDQQCTIHEIKPAMCRKWPFIDSLLRDMENWRVMAGVCPGIKTDVDEERLREFVRKSLADQALSPK